MILPPTHQHIVLPELHQEVEAVRSEFERLILPAWLLNAHDAVAVSRTQTHFLGDSPFMPATEGWPACDNCTQPLTFMWQINFAEFSGSGMLEERGLLQFFYCWLCFPMPMSDSEANEVNNDEDYFYGGLLAVQHDQPHGIAYRWYPDFRVDLASLTPQLSCPDEEFVFGAPLSCDPLPVLSLPDVSDQSNTLPDISSELDDSDLLAIRIVPAQIARTVSQLGGYPDWVQNEETPHCPVCKQPAVLVGALGSDDTNVIWGDTGYWYIFACKATPLCEGLRRPLSVCQCT